MDYPRLRRTITASHPQLLMMQNDYGNLYSFDIGNEEVFYNHSFDAADGDRWESAGKPVSIVIGSFFFAAAAEGKTEPAWNSDKISFNRWIEFSPASMFRYTVLQAGTCTEGGGVMWAAGPYPGGGWEMGVFDRSMPDFFASAPHNLNQ
ncbi:MAG: hypothetical protein JST28_22345 [Acidobacteria bacterium]|nr:hypothetical protein [Acidobacteriota bacterium]